ncbi:carboxymuconolactone decarboxylase family protein [Chelatococcus reniformis]|uniref:Alkyl hydroperoxide reductase AhpD n=1 Tax=Chelatococcus reniformis TaxID=1494448 RepID=A0A916TYS3_9HYPH|nr:carboxymuconolactone decarboxylase family protein [Chelatococcus reniformis]GGC53081.1 alkyl hydroperoxide reductase AhpD [Chelatococcus reniformis]
MSADTAPYIDLTPVEDATGDLKRLYDDLERVRGKGRVSNLFKAYGKFPALGEANFRRLNILLGQGQLSNKLKEAVMVALAEINHCTYCVAFHATAMQAHGASLDEISAARSFDPDRLGLSEKETALFEFALKANGDPHGITRADVAAVRAVGASDADLVEVLETVNTGNSFNLFAGALNVGADDFLNYSLEEGRFLTEHGSAAA